jgi:hypothetical protein
MSTHIRIPLEVHAVQWFKNGDHPDDNIMRPFVKEDGTEELPTEPREGAIVRYYRHPGVPDNAPCPDCGDLAHNHGFLEDGSYGYSVCPSNWVVTYPDGIRSVWTNPAFIKNFRPL